MISVTQFAFENIAISNVHAAQDGGDQDGEGQGQVRSMMLCFNVFLATFQLKNNYHKLSRSKLLTSQSSSRRRSPLVGFPYITLKSLL